MSILLGPGTRLEGRHISKGGGDTPELSVRGWRKKSIFRQCCHDILEHEREGYEWEVPGGLVRTTDLRLTIFLCLSQNGLCWWLCESRKTGLFAAPLNSSYIACNVCWLLALVAVQVGARGGKWALQPWGLLNSECLPATGQVRRKRQLEGESSRGGTPFLAACLSFNFEILKQNTPTVRENKIVQRRTVLGPVPTYVSGSYFLTYK